METLGLLSKHAANRDHLKPRPTTSFAESFGHPLESNGSVQRSGDMKAAIHPAYNESASCARAATVLPPAPPIRATSRRNLLRLPPFLYRQTKADGHRRSRGALPSQVRQERSPESLTFGPRSARDGFTREPPMRRVCFLGGNE